MKNFVVTSVIAASLIASASAASAATRRHVVAHPGASTNTTVVYWGNQVVGQDPDPSIRTQLLHDPNSSQY